MLLVVQNFVGSAPLSYSILSIYKEIFIYMCVCVCIREKEMLRAQCFCEISLFTSTIPWAAAAVVCMALFNAGIERMAPL